jgi:hypothetical protein
MKVLFLPVELLMFLFFSFKIHSIIYSMYNNLVENCFGGCVTSFRSKTLSKSEATCVENCSARYIKMTQRVGLRFAEHQAMQQKRAADAAAAGK